MITLAWIVAFGAAGVLALALVLHAIPRLGPAGRRLSASLCRAPGLDLVVFAFVHGPQIAGVWAAMHHLSGTWGAWVAAGAGLAAGVVSQAVGLILWMRAHEACHAAAMKGPRIKSTLNRLLGGGLGGAWRNYLAVWWTAWAVPVFTLIRIAQVLVYPPLTWLVRLPKYDASVWVRVSRQKFEGLVGADRIWCLYCDWMTGVWSLGGEMLRNVESFWCPIRFASPEKCERCTVDFPDVSGGWVDARAGMKDVVNVLEAKYPGPGGDNSWFGHPARRSDTPAVGVTVEGRRVEGP
ncbi:MAG: hypothetical protein HRU70_13630 [Phycisphaeraceae bacterium]|nr:MAG: hypothetical protein HRU70_13630 [Phycisphaeraceae bacterium]